MDWAEIVEMVRAARRRTSIFALFWIFQKKIALVLASSDPLE